MWFNDKLTIVAVCFCLSFGGVFGTSLRKREVSSEDADESTKDQNDSDIWGDLLGKGEDSSSKSSSKKAKDTKSDDDLIDDLDLDTDSKEKSRNSTKNTGSDHKSTKDSGSKKKTDNESKKKTPSTTTKSKNSTKEMKNEKRNTSTDGLSGSDIDDSFNWPNDQGWNGTSSTTNGTETSNFTSPSTSSTANGTKTSNVTFPSINSTTENPKANSTSGIWSNGTFDKTQNNSSQSITTPSSANNFTSAENVSSQIPHKNVTSTNSTNATTPTPETTQTTGYWIPIFNFGNNFYFLTNKGYAQLVNFPAPIIYTFKPISLRPAGAKPTSGHGQAGVEEEEIIGEFYDNGASFAECYININMGNLIPNSYFGSWVAVFKLELGWHLQTYGGFVPLDLTGEEAPLTYVFEPIEYQYSSLEKISTEANQPQGTNDAGLASWSEPMVVEE